MARLRTISNIQAVGDILAQISDRDAQGKGYFSAHACYSGICFEEVRIDLFWHKIGLRRKEN